MITEQQQARQYIERIIDECVDRILSESNVVTFGDKVYPNFGWCVIMGGGTGSGKGFAINSQLPIDGKDINVDDLKKLYISAQKRGLIDDPVEYDMGSPADVYRLHSKVTDKGWKEAERTNFFKPGRHTEGRLPNVIFDITGKSLSDIADIVRMAKPLGYRILFSWVVTNRSMAMFRNLKRERVVPQHVFHAIHNACNEFIPKFLKGGVSPVVREIDDAWLVFGSGDNLQKNSVESPCVRLAKTSDGFEIPSGVERQLYDILGPNEDNPYNPTTYLSSDDARRRMYTVKGKNGKDVWKTDEKDFLNKGK